MRSSANNLRDHIDILNMLCGDGSEQRLLSEDTRASIESVFQTKTIVLIMQCILQPLKDAKATPAAVIAERRSLMQRGLAKCGIENIDSLPEYVKVAANLCLPKRVLEVEEVLFRNGW